MNYYISYNNRVLGPMPAHQIFAYNPDPNTLISVDGYNWDPLYVFPELMQIYNSGGGYGYSGDSKRVLCGIMAILFGSIGIQYFIIGKVGAGFITILLSILTCGAWSIITLIQGILILCMSDSEFQRKYINSTATLPLF